MFIEELENRCGIKMIFKRPVSELKMERWEVRKAHEALTAIVAGWDSSQTSSSVDGERCGVCGAVLVIADHYGKHCLFCEK